MERRGKWCESLLGSLRVERCYYHCRSCGRGHVPWDQALGLGVRALTPAASEVASLAGVQTSFGQSAEVTFQKLCGLRLSESTVERVTEGAGERLAKLLEEKVTFGEENLVLAARRARQDLRLCRPGCHGRPATSCPRRESRGSHGLCGHALQSA